MFVCLYVCIKFIHYPTGKKPEIPRSNKLIYVLVSNSTAYPLLYNWSFLQQKGETEIMYSFAVLLSYIFITPNNNNKVINWRIEKKPFCFLYLKKKSSFSFVKNLCTLLTFPLLFFLHYISPTRHAFEHSIHAYLPIDFLANSFYLFILNLDDIFYIGVRPVSYVSDF